MQVKKEQKEQLEAMRQKALVKEAKIVKPLIPEALIKREVENLSEGIKAANAKLDGVQGEIENVENAVVCDRILDQVEGMLPQMSQEYSNLLSRIEELERRKSSHEVSVGIEVARVPLGTVAREELRQAKRIGVVYKNKILNAVSKEWGFEHAQEVRDIVSKVNQKRSNK